MRLLHWGMKWCSLCEPEPPELDSGHVRAYSQHLQSARTDMRAERKYLKHKEVSFLWCVVLYSKGDGGLGT